jgi:hypothetical protein
MELWCGVRSKNLIVNPLILFIFIIFISLSAGCGGGGGGVRNDGVGDDAAQGEGGTYYRDVDADGYGDPDDSITADSKPEGYVADNTDCNDDDATVYPEAQEICEDGIDQDCDGYDKKCNGDDIDGDGYKTDAGDCDDTDPAIYPGALEICGDGIDQDCDGEDSPCTDTYYWDSDKDGYGDPDVSVTMDYQPEGYVTDSTDCDDTNAFIHPGAIEECEDGIDQNCDGYDSVCTCCDEDDDGDGYNVGGGDCDNDDPDIYPGAPEVCGDGIDQDCDGEDEECTIYTYYIDADGDTYGNPDVSIEDTSQPEGYVTDNTDCDDSDASIHPGAQEICGDGIDQDCDGVDEECSTNIFYEDADGDGYGNPDVSIEDTTQPEGYVTNNADCDDNDATIHPGAEEICGDGIDQDCDGVDEECSTNIYYQDADGDTYGNPAVSDMTEFILLLREP